uniref:Uncharacterized protein n=1 Tax=Ananas comosus var. bracteatus TaxID=296719 RepID=A0A6V7Q5I0_ANACO|nr:unnamed protein product [Ananas comosus var. bracteatus]
MASAPPPDSSSSSPPPAPDSSSSPPPPPTLLLLRPLRLPIPLLLCPLRPRFFFFAPSAPRFFVPSASFDLSSTDGGLTAATGFEFPSTHRRFSATARSTTAAAFF